MTGVIYCRPTTVHWVVAAWRQRFTLRCVQMSNVKHSPVHCSRRADNVITVTKVINYSLYFQLKRSLCAQQPNYELSHYTRIILLYYTESAKSLHPINKSQSEHRAFYVVVKSW